MPRFREMAMKVRDLMITDVKSCAPSSSLDAAAQIMWDNDCGCLPVVDGDSRVIAMITDRDICMAAYTQGVALRDSRIASAMSRRVFKCRPENELAAAENTMRLAQVRRLPVVDAQGKLVGIISLNDIAREADREREFRAMREVADADISKLLASVSERPPGWFARG
jgi:CBS-domain-containing membrane protein